MKRKNVAKMKQGIVTKNKRQFILFALFVVLMGSWAAPSMAQCAMENKAFSAGERVTYDLFFNWKFIWLKAGTATLSTTGIVYQDEPCYNMELMAISSKRVDFFFKMRDTLTSVITEQLVPKRYRKGALEGKYYSVDEAWFSYKDGMSIVEQKRTYKDGSIVETRDSSYQCIFDMLSFLAQARSFDISQYNVGEEIHFSMVTGRKVANESLVYQGKENIKSDDGTMYRCLVFTFVEYGEVTEGAEKNQGKEVVKFFITDDENHIPVRMDFFLNFGSAKAFLKNIVGNRYPLTSIVQQ